MILNDENNWDDEIKKKKKGMLRKRYKNRERVHFKREKFKIQKSEWE